MIRQSKGGWVVALAVGVAAVLAASPVYGPYMRYSGTNLAAVNALFHPSGYDAAGEWSGQGSGLVFSQAQGEPGTVLLDMKTPHGTFSLPYTCEQRYRPRPAPHATCPNPPGGDPAVRFGGTNFAAGEPIVFSSADGVAQIAIYSEEVADPMVRYSGTGLTIQAPEGPVVVITVTRGSITLQCGQTSKTLDFVDPAAW
jgi:hypothetical protein